MNYSTFLKKLRALLNKLIREQQQQQIKISLLIPFQTDNGQREEVHKWLLKYWKNELPDAEIVIGHSRSELFCKTEALNDAARKAHGKVLVVLDADAYLYGKVIESCADKILKNPDDHLWYVPYRHLYRLNFNATQRIITSDPKNPLRLPSPPSPEDIDEQGHNSRYGHRYGAMIMMFPREALDILGCFDERFKGWGGEDVALLRALDTLYGKHKTTPNDILHLWHPSLGLSYRNRVWSNQKNHKNNKLANAYHKASKNPTQMRALVDEGCNEKRR